MRLFGKVALSSGEEPYSIRFYDLSMNEKTSNLILRDSLLWLTDEAEIEAKQK